MAVQFSGYGSRRDVFEAAHSAVNGPGREGGADFSINDYSSALLRGAVESGIGINFKSSPINAAIIMCQLDQIEGPLKQRADNLLYLTRRLKCVPGIKPPKEREGSTRGGWYGYRPFYDKSDFFGLKKDAFISLMRAEGADVSASGIKPFSKYPVVSDPQMQELVSLGRMKGNMFRIDPDGLTYTELNHERTLKFPVFNAKDAPQIYDQYIEAIRKIREALDDLPEDMFDEKIHDTGR